MLSGRLLHHTDFPSHHVPPRPVDVWLPSGYDAARPCPVLYMHDGQNLFDPALAYGGVTWGVAEALTRLMAEGIVPPTIIVGVWNAGGRRWQEYLPQRPFASLAGQQALAAIDPAYLPGPPDSDAYLRFLVTEVKPFIDQTYATQPEREHTFIMGSSMGGLISLYALCEYPDLFGGAGCVSTHWPAVDGVLPQLLKQLPPAGRHRFYFDFGTEELDAQYEPFQQQADILIAAVGYTQGQDWVTHKFPGANHSEQAWQQRVHIPLTFLLRD
ncbi:MAG: alpha/beta hydrolase [Anaerolineae bacterium]|nr:alpha/beta hydrolase [Anaerolineae bacterium]